MCCSPNPEVVRAATQYYTTAWPNVKTGKECYIVIVIYLKQTKLSCFSLFKEKKKAEVHPHSLISAFVVRCLDSIISLDSITEISRL